MARSLRMAKADHPEDVKARILFRDHMRDTRDRLGMSLSALGAKIGMTRESVAYMEQREDWSVSLMQRWSRAVKDPVVFKLDTLAPLDDSDAMYLIHKAAQSKTPHEVDGITRAQMHNDLVRLRKALGETAQAASERLGFNKSTLWSRENNYVGDLFISGVQAWARDFGAVQRIDTEKGIGSLDEGLWSTVQLMLHQVQAGGGGVVEMTGALRMACESSAQLHELFGRLRVNMESTLNDFQAKIRQRA